MLRTTAAYSEAHWGNAFRDEHPDISAAIREATSATKDVLGANLLSLGLSGSLAIGDFDKSSSDIDLIAVVASDLTDEEQAVLQHVHNTIRANGNWWTTRIEVAYLPLRACSRIETQPERYYMLCVDGQLRLSQPRTDWIVQKHILREFGPTLTGAAPRTLIAAADASQLRATATLAAVPFITSSCPGVLPEKTLALHVLSMCRVLYTRQKGDVASKAAAADWAKSTGPSSWHLIIDAALHGRAGTQLVPTAAAYGVIREMASSLTNEGES